MNLNNKSTSFTEPIMDPSNNYGCIKVIPLKSRKISYISPITNLEYSHEIPKMSQKLFWNTHRSASKAKRNTSLMFGSCFKNIYRKTNIPILG